MLTRVCWMVIACATAVACGGGDGGGGDGAAIRVGEFEMEGVSMEPTLRDGDKVEAFAIAANRPARGDVIVFRPTTQPSRNVIKRVIGLPGDTVEITEPTGDVSLNGEVLEEPYVSGPTECVIDCEWKLPKAGSVEARERCGSDACYFVMGDHREDPGDSADSRKGFLVTAESIIGRVEAGR